MPRTRRTDHFRPKIRAAAMTVMATGVGWRVVRSGTWRWGGPVVIVVLLVKRVWMAKYRPRLAMTPTTAAVIPVRRVHPWAASPLFVRSATRSATSARISSAASADGHRCVSRQTIVSGSSPWIAPSIAPSITTARSTRSATLARGRDRSRKASASVPANNLPVSALTAGSGTSHANDTARQPGNPAASNHAAATRLLPAPWGQANPKTLTKHVTTVTCDCRPLHADPYQQFSIS